MTAMIAWIASNWTFVLAVMWVADQVVKLTPTKYDNILIDVIGGFLKKLITGKGGPIVTHGKNKD